MHQDVNSNSRGSLLKEMEIDSDSDVPEYSLPPKSIVKRPKKSTRKRTRSSWRKACRNCCRYCSGVVIILVLCACVLSIALLFWFSLRLYRDVENLTRRLTIEINRVQTEQVTNVEKCTSLKLKMNENMEVLKNGQKDVENFKRQLHLSHVKIAELNGTLLKLSKMFHSPSSKTSLHNTVNALQKGMADTGAEMTKISDEIKQIKQQSSLQSRAIRNIVFDLFNISSELANITGKSSRVVHNGADYLEQKLHDENESKKENSNGSLSEELHVYDVIHGVNNSLSAQMKHLRLETEALKMKSSLSTYDQNSVNISHEIIRVQRDISAIQELIIKLNAQVGNLTQSNMNSNHIYENSIQIRLLWQELELQNQTIVEIQKIVDGDMAYKPEMGPRRRVNTDSSKNDNFEVFSETSAPVSTASEQKRDVLKTQRKSYTKYSDSFDALLEDSIT